MRNEIEKRRTFAIVSHPDAGKTTITEKFLWYGKVIREAGHVRAKQNRSHTTSDWMKIEQQRGISVSSSVLNFPHGNSQFNLLDTPGHQDFSEDTYRALTAVDSALVLLDSVNGVERQTIKLMDVCRLRKTPIITFINKMDLDGKDAIDLIDEIEEILKIKCAPFSLPIGYGKLFKGVYSIIDDTLHSYSKDGSEQEVVQLSGIDDPKLDDLFDERDVTELRERYDLVTGVMEPFDQEAFLNGDQCPVFYGSAIANFGVKQLLDTFERLAPPPLPRDTDVRVVDPHEEKFSGFIFKIQANMDPKHRDRTAFMRICSGKFERGSKVVHCRTGKKLSMAAPTSFMAKNKDILDVAYAGDIVGINDPGIFNIGDTLTAGEKFKFHGIPHFAPEYFAKVTLENPLKSKQMKKGLDQLSEEGATQLFQPIQSPTAIIGVVGELQFDVLKHRLEHEYQANVILDRFNVFEARWIVGDKEEIKKFVKEYGFNCSTDKEGNLVCLFPNEFKLNLAEKNYEGLTFEKTMEN
ncbi:MAG: peptide chain release factor 3 [Fibrobacterales bacterium]